MGGFSRLLGFVKCTPGVCKESLTTPVLARWGQLFLPLFPEATRSLRSTWNKVRPSPLRPKSAHRQSLHHPASAVLFTGYVRTAHPSPAKPPPARFRNTLPPPPHSSPFVGYIFPDLNLHQQVRRGSDDRANRYLSVARHPAIAEAASRATAGNGFRAGASRLPSGETAAHAHPPGVVRPLGRGPAAHKMVNTSRLKVTISVAHSPGDVDPMVNALAGIHSPLSPPIPTC